MCLRMNYKIGTSSYSFRNSREDAPGRARLLGWKQHTGIPALAILDPCSVRRQCRRRAPAGRYLCLSTYISPKKETEFMGIGKVKSIGK